MTQKIRVGVDNSFGRRRYYPACDLSRVLAELTGHKSLTDEQLAILTREGWAIEKVPFVRE